MIAKVCKRGARASGLLRYLTGDNKAGHVRLDDADAKRLDAPSAQRPDIERPIWHAALSLPQDEHLTAEQWREVTADFVQHLGLDRHEWTAVVHNETAHQHCHVVANRIDYSGNVWTGEFDGKRAIEVAKALEIAYGLTVDTHTPAKRTALSQPEIEKALRTGTQPTRTTLQELVDEAVQGRPDFSTFADRLQAVGVQVIPNISGERVSGVTFSYDGITFKGSDLGKRKYAWSALQERINYEQERDGAKVHECARCRAGGESPCSEVGRRNSSGTRRLGGVHGGHHEHDERRPNASSPGGKERWRHDQDNSQAPGSNISRDAGNSPGMGSDGKKSEVIAPKPLSARARHRGPIRDSRKRISDLAASLLARFSGIEPEPANCHDRHRRPSDRDNQQVAAVPGRER